MKIVTHHVFPPIPIRSMDWIAYRDGDEPNDNGQMLHGSGATESEAIEDLLDQTEPIPDVDDSDKVNRCRDPYLSRESYGDDT